MRHLSPVRILVLAAALLTALVTSAVESLQIRVNKKLPLTLVDGKPFLDDKGEPQYLDTPDYGRGCVIAKDTVLTVYHVVEAADKEAWPIDVLLGDKWTPATIKRVDTEHDLALLTVLTGDRKPTPLVDIPPAQILADPGHEPATAHLGYVDSLIVQPEDIGMTKPADAAGMSGGPLVIEGRLVGVISMALQRQKTVPEKLPDGTFFMKVERVGPVLLLCTGPAPIEALLDQK